MFNANDMVNIQDLAAMNDALRKATSVGYQDTSGVIGADAGDLSALVPQSIEGTLATATFSMKELALWPAIPKRSVANTIHEFVRINEHGFDMDPFLSEGGAGARNVASYERGSVKIKYLAERREVSDVGSLVGIIGNSANAIAEETTRGTFALLGRLERALWHGNESANSLAFDGIIKQIEDNAPNNVYDLEGNAPTPQLLQDILGEIYAAPRYGRPDCIYVEPRIHAELIRFAVDFGRHDQLKVMSSAQGITYGTQRITIMGPVGPVEVRPAPFLADSFEPPASAYDPNGNAVAPTLVASTIVALGGGEVSKFSGATLDYNYSAVIVTPESGYSDPVALGAAQTVAPGEKVQITVTHPAVAASTNAYIRLYRSTGGGTVVRKIKEVKLNYNNTNVISTNEDLPARARSSSSSTRRTSRVRAALGLLPSSSRRGCASKPFLLMLFGSPIVKVPSKCWVIKNAAVATGTKTSNSLLYYR